MNRTRPHLGAQALLAAVAAATSWVALLSWRGFTAEPARYLGPLLVLGVAIAGVGAVARTWRVPGPLVVLAQVVVSSMLASVLLCGSPIPVGARWHRLVDSFQTAVHSANQYAPPVPAGVPGVHPLLIAGGLGCLLLVDVLACTARRVPLAGLPLLTIYSVPVSMLGGGLSWWVFALTAAGFLSLLFLHESEQVTRWGRALGDDPDAADPEGFGVRTGAVRASAGAIGGVVTALAVVVPLAVPTLGVHLLDIGAGTGSGGDINLTNPMVSLQRDLQRGDDVPLLTVRTDDPDPSYLRIAVLNSFASERWSSGDRNVPATQRAQGVMPPLVGVQPSVGRKSYPYRVQADPAFESTWLPTTQNVQRIDAAGDWRYDPADMDFLASDDHLTAADLSYTFTAVKLSLNADSLARAGSSTGLVGRQFTTLPDDINPVVRNLAYAVTRNESTKFGKAVALQQWFRQDGNFVYDTSTHLGDGADDLATFLQQGKDGRRGYCQQFAAAMAVMARILGIPARVAVGFLSPDRVGRDTYVYSSHDLHAWPELFFPGSGWVRFEPTPAGRATSVPGYTTQPITVPDVTVPTESGSASNDVPTRGDPSSTAQSKPDQSTAGQNGSSGSGLPWGRLAGGAGLVVILAAGLLGPGVVRRRRRERRQTAGPEEAWAELRDTALDLRVPWPRARSPRQTRDALVRSFGSPGDDPGVERPRRGPGTNPVAVAALDRIVLALERLRYARADGTSPEHGADGWRAEVTSCVEAMTAGAPRSVRRLATWWPRSVFSRPTTIRVRPVAPSAEESVSVGVVDHVGL